jgi:apolipoprotein N-acyltransferase
VISAAAPRSLLHRWAPLIAFVAGGVTVLSFAPFGFWPIQIATMAFVFWLVIRQESVRASMAIGWAYGSGWAIFGVYWLYISMHHYGGMPAWMAALAVAVLGMVLGIYPALAMGVTTWFKRRGASPALLLLGVLPAAWMLNEWLRGWMFTGFPWLVSGYAHTSNALSGYAPVVGVYGLGWLAALLAGSLVLLQAKRAALFIIVIILGVGAGLRTVGWTTPHGEPISVRLLQGNIAQEMKFDTATLSDTLALYYQMISEQPADLIATPETALPLMSNRLPENYLPQLEAFSEQSGSHIAVGLPVSDGPNQYANSVIGLNPDPAAEPYRYDKHHLVPFGEFIPVGARWFVEMMNVPLGDFTRGDLLQQPFAVKDQWVMPNICYEDLFGEEIADQLAAAIYNGKPQPTILLNMSNIAWFGDTIALPQHLQISQMRALETRRPMLRATNSGATAIIEPTGSVGELLQPYTRGSLNAVVQGYRGWTPYILYGNTLVVILAFLLFTVIHFALRKKDA